MFIFKNNIYRNYDYTNYKGEIDMKNNDVKFLNKLYQNANMGVSSLSSLIPKLKDERLKNEMQTQLAMYQGLSDDIKCQIYSYNAKPKDINAFIKASAELSINMSTMMNKSPSHMAEMFIKGTNMGIIDINKNLNETSVRDKNILNKADELLKFEQENIDRMKSYL